MKLFKKNKTKESVLTDRAAGWLANGILKVQQKFANVLGKISVSWKAKQQWIFLYMVCLVFGGLSVVAVVNPFNKKSQNIISKPAAIKIPRMIPDEKKYQVRITDNEIKKIHAFKKSLDSTAKKKLLIKHPGLMDSLEMVEQLYYSEKK